LRDRRSCDRHVQPDRHRMKHLPTGSLGTGARGLCNFVMSFSYLCGVPRDGGLILDARFLKRPQYAPEPQQLTERGPRAAHIARSRRSGRYFTGLRRLPRPTLMRDDMEAKTPLTFFGTSRPGGRHRSVCLAEPALRRDRPGFGTPGPGGSCPAHRCPRTKAAAGRSSRGFE
jgi:RNase adaptor protein for sRNA GlmZ degradation